VDSVGGGLGLASGGTSMGAFVLLLCSLALPRQRAI
jgi:hypothetical protein